MDITYFSLPRPQAPCSPRSIPCSFRAGPPMAEAQRLVLDAHLRDIAELAERLPDEIRRHELVRLLLAHGHRPFEDFVE